MKTFKIGLSLLATLVLSLALASVALAADTVITMQLGSPNMTVNGVSRPIDSEGTAPVAQNGRTLLPLRAIAESLGLTVDWDEATQTITLHSEGEESAAPTPAESKILVAYYSATGSTKTVAGYVANALGADLFEITPEQPYTTADLNWSNSSSRVSREHEDESLRAVELVSATVENWDSYDTVFIGYPIWWGIAAWPTNGFVEANSFEGKTVIPFCTSTSSGLGDSGKLLAELAGSGDWRTGQRFSSGASESTVAAWAKGLNLPASR